MFIFREDLGCRVHHVQYEFALRAGHLRIDKGSHVDMDACIALFTAIDPNVETFGTYYGPSQPDTIYVKHKGKWQATIRKRIGGETFIFPGG